MGKSIGENMLEDLIGKYRGQYRDAVRARSIELEIVAIDGERNQFTLEITDAGQFGSVGTIYRGSCVIDHERVTLHADTRTEWRDTIIEEDEEYEYPCSETFGITLNVLDGRLRISLTLYGQETVLEKEQPNHP